MLNHWRAPALTLLAAALYWATVAWHHNATPIPLNERPAEVVITGPIQLLLYGGDRFLAADIEAIRAAASATASDAHHFSLRAHLEVSHLNPCHEDNYWIGNASLSWGGTPMEGLALLQNAMRCRYWDEWPAFFYGFNQHFFLHDTAKARQALEIAARRSPQNAAAFRTLATMLTVGEIDDARLAVELLQRERDKTRDPALRDRLDKRLVRLNGLVTLRDAQATFEKRFKRPLQQPQELLESGIVQAFPADPMKLGYEFRDQTFHLRQMQIE